MVDDAPNAAERVSAAKFYVGRKVTDVVQNCIHVHVAALATLIGL